MNNPFRDYARTPGVDSGVVVVAIATLLLMIASVVLLAALGYEWAN